MRVVCWCVCVTSAVVALCPKNSTNTALNLDVANLEIDWLKHTHTHNTSHIRIYKHKAHIIRIDATWWDLSDHLYTTHTESGVAYGNRMMGSGHPKHTFHSQPHTHTELAKASTARARGDRLLQVFAAAADGAVWFQSARRNMSIWVANLNRVSGCDVCEKCVGEAHMGLSV